mgnify:CR=1 FL=1
MEAITLSTPESQPSTPDYQIESLTLDWGGSRIYIVIVCVATGKRRAFDYTGDVAKNLMVALNTANLTTNSLHKRILSKLIIDGKLAGTVTGSPY